MAYLEQRREREMERERERERERELEGEEAGEKRVSAALPAIMLIQLLLWLDWSYCVSALHQAPSLVCFAANMQGSPGHTAKENLKLPMLCSSHEAHLSVVPAQKKRHKEKKDRHRDEEDKKHRKSKRYSLPLRPALITAHNTVI